MDNRPIGVFDSGLGGLTAVRRLRQILPDENIIYFGDTGRMPYGGRRASRCAPLRGRISPLPRALMQRSFLLRAERYRAMRQEHYRRKRDENYRRAPAGCRKSFRDGRKELGVIATKTSIESGAFQLSISRFAPDAKITAAACPDFVPMIESGHYLPDDPMVQRIVAQSLEPLKDVGALLLGCTHYGLIADAISAYLGKDVVLVGAADASAETTVRYLRDCDMLASGGGSESYYTSGSTADFEALAPIMLGYGLKSAVNYVEPFALD